MVPVSAAASPSSLRLWGSTPGLHVCLDPQAAERLSLSGPLHTQHKQARLQALETMADVLQQRVDILTAKLRRDETPDPAGELALDLPPPGPSATPTTPRPATLAFPRALVPRGDTGSLHGDFLDVEVWGPESHPKSESQGGAGAVSIVTVGGREVPLLPPPLGFFSQGMRGDNSWLSCTACDPPHSQHLSPSPAWRRRARPGGHWVHGRHTQRLLPQ